MAEWCKVAILAAAMTQPHSKKQIDPVKFIPPAFRPRFRSQLVNKPKAVVDEESPAAWEALNRFFTQGGKKPGKYVIRAGGKGPAESATTRKS